ncbi:hypothetical protein PMAYCL1PPCAC_08154, partial [Pristionchus mayeri]
PLTLIDLPAELIMIIVRTDEESVKVMRLISRSWNDAVLSHLRDRRYQPALERVFITAANDSDYEDIDEWEVES